MSDRAVEAEFVFGRHAATELSVAYAILAPQRQARIMRPASKDGRPVTSAAIYARVSSARQKKDETIGSQTAALREHAAQARLDVPADWVFEDEGSSAAAGRPGPGGAAGPGRPGLLGRGAVYSPDRLARKFAYQALLLEEFARAGVRVEFVKGPRGETPEDQLLVQFQGIFAEYEKAQLAERYRRGKAYRARTGSVNVLSGAPFGYRYVRKTDLCVPPTRSSSARRYWSRRCSAATPTTARPSRTWPAG